MEDYGEFPPVYSVAASNPNEKVLGVVLVERGVDWRSNFDNLCELASEAATNGKIVDFLFAADDHCESKVRLAVAHDRLSVLERMRSDFGAADVSVMALAVARDSENVFRAMLAAGANVNARDDNGPLHHHATLKMLCVLFAHGVDLSGVVWLCGCGL
jgi:hypothetical protein